MSRSTILRLSVAAIAVLSAGAFADDVKPRVPGDGSTPDPTFVPFTGAEEPRPGDLMIGGKLAGPARTERAAFLGVGASSVDATLRSQLDLPKGVGLRIDFVEKEGPAASAGVQQHDVLQKLNDQILVNAPQLATLIRTFKAGDEVTLSVIRKGKPLELKAKLIERDLPPLADAGDPFTINFAREPAQIEQFRFSTPPGELDALPRRWMNPSGQLGPRVIRLSPDSTRIISRDDGTHSIQLSQRGDQTTLTVKDAGGKTLFDGPYNTEEEKAKLPEELREKVKKMQDGIEFKPASPTTNPSEPKAEADRVIDALFGRRGLST